MRGAGPGLVFALAFAAAAPAHGQTVHIVRHAEKAMTGADPGLTPEGQARAAALAELLTEAPDLILTSPALRTRLTAAPTAMRFERPVEAVPLDDGLDAHVAATVARLRALAPDQTALVVGHSNTAPLIARGLGVEAMDMADCEYDRRLIVTLSDAGAAVRAERYGAASDC